MKRSFTLLELIIAISLAAILLSTLLFFYSQVYKADQKLFKIEETNFHLMLAESRLQDVLPKTVSQKTKKGDFVFFTTKGSPLFKEGTESLLFIYDNGIDLDKPFSNHVLGRLFVDKEGQLTLATWPSPKRWEDNSLPPMKKDVLLTNVDGLSFSFFVPPDRGEKRPVQAGEIIKGKEQLEPQPKGAWISPWLKEYNTLPALVRVEVKQKDKTTVFATPLPNGPPIFYKR